MRSDVMTPQSNILRRADRLNRIALALAIGWLILIGLTITPEVDDYKWYWQGAHSFLETGDPYQLKDDPAGLIPAQSPSTVGDAYLYPPLFAYLMQPLAMIGYHPAQWIWFAINTLLLGVLIALCQRLAGAALTRRWWGVLILAMLLAPPTRLSLQLGQVSLLVAVLLVGCLALEKHPAAGWLLATASWIKLTPSVIGLRYVLRRPRSVLWWTIAAALVLLALSLLLYGHRPYLSFVDNVILGREYPYAAEHNISLYGFSARLLAHSRYAIPLLDSPTLARVLQIVTSLAILGLCVWASYAPKLQPAADGTSHLQQTTDNREDANRRQPAPAGDTNDSREISETLGTQLLFCLWLCTMLLLSPSNGYYNLVVLLLPLLVVLRYLELHPNRQVRRWLIVGTALVCIPPTWSDWQPQLYNTVHVGWGLLALTPSLYGLLIYTILLAILNRRVNSHQEVDDDANNLQRPG
jgi:hypothetical protein